MQLIKTTDNGRKIFRHNGVNFFIDFEQQQSLWKNPSEFQWLAEDIKTIEEAFWSNEHEDWMGVCDDPTEYAIDRCESLNILCLCGKEDQ